MVVKIADAVKRYLYLQGQTGLLNHFVDFKVFHSFSGLANPNRFSDSFRSGLHCPVRMLNPVRKGGGGKRLCTWVLYFFTLTRKFHFILFSDNPKQYGKLETEEEELKDGEAIGSGDQPFVSKAYPSCRFFFALRRFPLLMILCSRQWSDTRLPISMDVFVASYSPQRYPRG